MLIKVDISSLRQTTWHEYAVRFLFGGFITAVAGIIAKEWGPAVGGLFLAFPAIFPASATLIEKHTKEKLEQKGFSGAARGRKAAALDAAGSAIGSTGLLIFAFLVWRLLQNHSAGLVLILATVAWLVVSVLLWIVRKRM